MQESGWLVDKFQQAPPRMENVKRMKRLSGLRMSRLLERVFRVVGWLRKYRRRSEAETEEFEG